jgi:outer membrane protein
LNIKKIIFATLITSIGATIALEAAKVSCAQTTSRIGFLAARKLPNFADRKCFSIYLAPNDSDWQELYPIGKGFYALAENTQGGREFNGWVKGNYAPSSKHPIENNTDTQEDNSASSDEEKASEGFSIFVGDHFAPDPDSSIEDANDSDATDTASQKSSSNQNSLGGVYRLGDGNYSSASEVANLAQAKKSIKKNPKIFLEAKAGYFYPASHRFRKIYSNGSGIYGIELNVKAYDWLYVFASGNYFVKNGHSIGGKHRTKVALVPLALGLEYVHWKHHLGVYAGVGVTSTYLNTHYHSQYVIHSVSKWGVGGVAKLGLLVDVYKRLYLDLFTNYYYARIHFHNTHGGKLMRNTANVGGLSAGVGLGFRF